MTSHKYVRLQILELTNPGVFPSTIGTSDLGDCLSEGTAIRDLERSVYPEEEDPREERPQMFAVTVFTTSADRSNVS